jgi:hypothetical protein
LLTQPFPHQPGSHSFDVGLMIQAEPVNA